MDEKDIVEPWSYDRDSRYIELEGCPIFRVFGADDFPCIEDEDRWEAERDYLAHAGTVVLLLNAIARGNFGTTGEAVKAYVEVKALAMHQASSPQDGGWRPIETAPQDGESILAICNSAYSPKANVTWWSGAWTLYSRPDDKWHGGVSKWWPTHWMPLPAPPTLTGVSTNG